MNTVVINIMDEVNVHIQDVELTHRRRLANAVKYFLPHARYSPAFKLGRWDGCASFCTLGGKTYLNALDKLLPILVDAGYDVEIVDDRHKHDLDLTAIDDTYLSDRMWPPGHRAQGEPIVLRDYQVQLVNECLANPQGLIIAPTSSGKTIVTATLSRRVEHIGRTIVIVPNKNLVEQTLEDYQNVGLDVGVIFGDRKEFDRQHTICTWQSLNVLDKKNKDALDDDQLAVFLDQQVAVIVDECFDGDSKVLTPEGYVPIKNLKPGDKVINYSESTKEFKQDVVVKQHVNLTNSYTEKMYELEFDNGSIIKVTGNHKFMTNKGWCRADELTEDHEIINLS